MAEFCFSTYNIYNKRGLLWNTLDYIKDSYSDVNCVVCFQELPVSVMKDFNEGYAAAMDKKAKTSPKKRAAWKYKQISRILTCFSRKDFPGCIQTFHTGRKDFLAVVIEHDGKRIGIINCHQTCSRLANVQQYMVDLFAVVLRFQSGGFDSEERFMPKVDGVVLAGDLNLKNIYYGRGIDRSKPYTSEKPKLQLCYLLLLSGLRPCDWKDKSRGYEIDYLCTSKNFVYCYEIGIAIPPNEDERSDHPPYGAVFKLSGALEPSEFAIKHAKSSWSKLTNRLTHKINTDAKLLQVVKPHLERLPKTNL